MTVKKFPLTMVSIKELQDSFDKEYRGLMEPRPEPGFSSLHVHLQKDLELSEPFKAAVIELTLEPLTYITFLMAEKEHVTKPHVDQDNEGDPRFHLPVYTGRTTIWQGETPNYMLEGSWYGPVTYWKEHWVEHVGNTRVHLIVDVEQAE